MDKFDQLPPNLKVGFMAAGLLRIVVRANKK